MKAGKVVPQRFFIRPAEDVARDLLSCQLCRHAKGTIQRWPIIETEAYIGPEDQACHARAGRTRRTEVMYGPPGHWYVYLCYGIHWLLNIVTQPKDFPAAVLIRGAGEVSGPGRLTKALHITGEHNTQPASRESGLWIEAGPPCDSGDIQSTPRIGVDYAGPDWSQRPYRFLRNRSEL